MKVLWSNAPPMTKEMGVHRFIGHAELHDCWSAAVENAVYAARQAAYAQFPKLKIPVMDQRDGISLSGGCVRAALCVIEE